MKKIFNFGSRRELSPGRSSFSPHPRRDSGVRPFGPQAGYVVKMKELGKIHKAAAIGDVAKVQQLLLLGLASVDDLDKENRTPLHLACANGYPDLVSLLVERKCKLNLHDNDCQTPLIKAVQCQQEECATILLEHGADPSIMDTHHNTALHYAASGHNIMITAKLLRYKIEMEAKNKEGYTPFLLAVTENNQDMVDLFLKNGANVNASDRFDRTALMIAASCDPKGVVSLLLQYDIDLSCRDTLGWTAEEYAVFSGHSINYELINQYGKQKALNQPLSPQISSSEKASDPIFTLGGPAKDQEDLTEELGLDDADDIDDVCDWDSASTSQKNVSYRSSKDWSFNVNYPDQSGSTVFGKIPFKEDEAVGVRTGPDTGFRVMILGEKPVPQKPYEPQLPLNTEEDEEDASHWDSASTSLKNESYRSFKDLSFNVNYPCQSLPVTKYQSGSTEFRTMPFKDEASAAGSGPENDFRVVILGEKPVCQKPCEPQLPLKTEEDKEGSLKRHSILKPIQPTIEMKDPFIHQELGKGVKEKQKSYLMEELGLDESDDIDGVCDWDSTSTSPKNESCSSSKDLNFNGNYPCQSLPVTKNQSGSTEFGKIAFKEDEVGAGSGPENGFGVVILEEKSICQKHGEPRLPQKKEEATEGNLLALKEECGHQGVWASIFIPPSYPSRMSGLLSKEIKFTISDPAGSSEEHQESDLEQNKVQMDANDSDDHTRSSDTVTEDCDLPPLNCKNVLSLIEQLSVDCKDAIKLLKIEDAVLRYNRLIEHKQRQCSLLARKVKSLENKITGLQEELSETREKKSQLELQKAEWNRELHSIRFTLKQEETKQVTTEMLFQKIRQQLRRKEQQYSKEMELKQQLQHNLRTLDLELRTVRNHLKQVEEERNDTQRQLSQELRARALQAGIQNNPLCKQKEIEACASKMTQTSEVPDSNEKEKYLLDKNQILQDEVAMLQVELDTLKIKDQEKASQFTEENEVLKEENDELQKKLQLNEEALTKIISQYSGQVNVLTTENAMLNSKLENAKQNRARLETEIESYHSRLTSAVHDHERSQTSKLDLERTFQRERDEWLRLQRKLNHDLTSLRENNAVLCQKLSKAENKANSLENELYHVHDSLREKTLVLESTQRELSQAQHKAQELEHTNQLEKEKLKKYVVKYESMQERLTQIQSKNMLLQQQLEDAQNKGIIKEKVLSDAQGEFTDLFSKVCADTEKQVLKLQERNKELISECNHLREKMCKYENEKAEREATVRKLQQELADSLKNQSMTETSLEVTLFDRNDFEDKKKLQKELQTEREKLKKLIELKQSVENHLEREMKKNDELQKDLSGFKKLLKTTKKKLREYEKGDVVYQGGVKQTYSEMEREISMLKNKIEELTQQLEAASSTHKQLESINQSSPEDLFSVKILQKKCDKPEGKKKELEEEVLNLRHKQ
ncbi:ankyrin repeat domain-containing protein 26-like isoform X2 [Notamacropus eugenii]|uniref:ankyrin repeat domain-containing protein 26-like isoform X2 n=1 Tax=Notamacropus eugenii TaxID=9315 RepID=UPI003B67441E